MLNKIRLVAIESKSASTITPAERQLFLDNYSFCNNCGTAEVLKTFKEFINNKRVLFPSFYTM